MFIKVFSLTFLVWKIKIREGEKKMFNRHFGNFMYHNCIVLVSRVSIVSIGSSKYYKWVILVPPLSSN